MYEARLTIDNQVLFLNGEINFSNAMLVYRKSLQVLPKLAHWHINFSKLEGSNSAVLALVLEWVKTAKQRNRSIKFSNFSNDFLKMIKIAGLENLIKNYSV